MKDTSKYAGSMDLRNHTAEGQLFNNLDSGPLLAAPEKQELLSVVAPGDP